MATKYIARDGHRGPILAIHSSALLLASCDRDGQIIRPAEKIGSLPLVGYALLATQCVSVSSP